MGCTASSLWSSHCEGKGGWGKRSIDPISLLLNTPFPSNTTNSPTSTPTLHGSRDPKDTELPLPALVTFLSFVILLGVLLCVYFCVRGQRRARERGGRGLREEDLERGDDEEVLRSV